MLCFFDFCCLTGVNHILEVYDLPKGIKNNESDELFEDLIKAGARIKWLNSSASGSQETPIVAIFSSSAAADYALNSMPSNKFKLRLPQHTSRPAHADSNAPIISSSSS
ncbi:R3H domain-containing protein 1 [Desmophyllum pertusum]|uniref:R3H domain-containing protein 1 n=1 Tax=Desmophyllum pertusum TaxID=174260 RepID=A0A9W9ZQG7_9CNID|nr:R3H domain-containing protein 1 [Desmophyllum pertusum]